MKRIKDIIKKKVEKVFNSDLQEQFDKVQSHYTGLYEKHKKVVADFNELYNDHRKMKTELNSIIEQKNKTIKQLNGKCASYSRQLKAQKERAKEYLEASEMYKTKANKFNTECIELGQKNFDLAVNMRSVIGKIHRIYNELRQLENKPGHKSSLDAAKKHCEPLKVDSVTPKPVNVQVPDDYKMD